MYNFGCAFGIAEFDPYACKTLYGNNLWDFYDLGMIFAYRVVDGMGGLDGRIYRVYRGQANIDCG